MKPIFKNVLAVVLGWFGGSVVNMGLIQVGHQIIPIEGVDVNDMEAFANVLPSLGIEYFIFPFLAHALGTFFGAVIAGLIAANHKMKFSLSIGALFLLGGIVMSFMLPGPTWFTITDILIAYLPMAFLGGKIAMSFNKK